MSATKTDKREKVAIWLEIKQLEALRKRQKRDGVPVSEQVRRAIAEALKRNV